VKKLMPLILVTALVGCATGEVLKLEYGPPPTEYETKIKNYLDRSLKDRDSLRDFKVLTTPKKGALNYGAFEKGPTGKSFSNQMWYVCAEYNAKNSYGGYVGIKTYAYFFFNNKIERVILGSIGGGDLGNTVYNCN
tara:strand:+ start:174 stop:581 length:408 start_codon:yes stop_codon:yes gene_type:complete